jgi:hypothetical protein
MQYTAPAGYDWTQVKFHILTAYFSDHPGSKFCLLSRVRPGDVSAWRTNYDTGTAEGF